LRDHRGPAEAVLFARSATAGCQQFPVHWGGDCESSFESMAETLRGGLSLAMSGFGFWSHDIGGFEGTPDPAVFLRWLPFGLLSTHSRLHGNQSYRVPWLFGDEAVDVLRTYTRLKARLMPYLYGAARGAHHDGVPVLRPMVFDFPDDPACAHLDRQYMLGDDLLVAPVFSTDGQLSYYVPDGPWTHLRTGEVVSGPRWHQGRFNIGELPLLVRPGAVVPFGAVDDRPDYPYPEGVTLRAYQLRDGARVTVPVPLPSGEDGARFTVRRDGSVVVAERTGPPAPWSLVLVGEDRAPVSMDAGTDRCEIRMR
jgi:alpha-D-xyloside xylohydrolase